MIKMKFDVLPERARRLRCSVGAESDNEDGVIMGKGAEVPFSPLHVSVKVSL